MKFHKKKREGNSEMYVVKYTDSTNEWNTEEIFESLIDAWKTILLEMKEVMIYLKREYYISQRRVNNKVVIDIQSSLMRNQWARWELIRKN